jgi:hypothetical protein
MQTVLQKWTADGRFARLFGPHGIETVQHPAAFGAAVSAELRPLYRAGERNDSRYTYAVEVICSPDSVMTLNFRSVQMAGLHCVGAPGLADGASYHVSSGTEAAARLNQALERIVTALDARMEPVDAGDADPAPAPGLR